MTEADALRRAVVTYPDDDTPRLIFADWLDEHGQAERATLIRVQLEAARAEPWSPAARAADEHAKQLLARHGIDWFPAWAESVQVGYHRGFIEQATISSHAFSRLAEPLFENEPVRELGLARPWAIDDDDFTTSLGPVFTSSRLRQIHALDLGHISITPDELYGLLDCEHLRQLRSLALPGNPISPHWLTEFLAGQSFSELVDLNLAHNAHLGPALVRGLTKADHRRLRRLDLSGMASLTSDLLQRLLALPAISRLEELQFGWPGGPSQPGPVAHLDLAWVVPWRNLRLLDLTGQWIGTQGVREIAAVREAIHLRWLSLASNGIDADGVEWLCKSPHLQLLYLDIRKNGLDRRHVAALRERFPDALVLS